MRKKKIRRRKRGRRNRRRRNERGEAKEIEDEDNFGDLADLDAYLDLNFVERSPPPEARPIPSYAAYPQTELTQTGFESTKPAPPTEEQSLWTTLDSILVAIALLPGYLAWSQACSAFFADTTGTVPFPYPAPHHLPAKLENCNLKGCVRSEKLGVCKHEMEGVG